MPDAAGDVGASPRNLTVGNRQRRACGWLAASAFCYDGNVPEPVIGRLGERGRSGGTGGSESKKHRANASEAHESKSRKCV